MARHYYHHHPRGFANECTITRVPVGSEILPSGERISVRQLRAHLSWMRAEPDMFVTYRDDRGNPIRYLPWQHEYPCGTPAQIGACRCHDAY